MKTITVSEEMYEKLIQLAAEMTTQDPRATRMPHIFQIRDWRMVYDWSLNGDTRIWIGDYEEEIESLEDLKNYLESKGIEHGETELTNLWNDDKDFGLPDWIEENCPDLKECSYSLEPFFTNSFLTAKAAQKHLDLNYYHYHKKADVYLSHGWRNPEAELVTEFLCGLVGKKMHT
jgi:hypothetical protein